MSIAEILEELPKLTRQERKAIIERAFDLNHDEIEREEIAVAEACALELCQMLDKIEADEEARRVGG